MAFIWVIGKGVRSRSVPSLSRQKPPTWAYHAPAHAKYSLVRTQPLGRPVVPDVYSSAHSLNSSGVESGFGAAEICGKSCNDDVTTATSRPARKAAPRMSGSRGVGTTAAAISEWPNTYSSSAPRQSELIGMTEAPSEFKASQ